MKNEELNSLIEVIRQISTNECQKIIKTSNIASNHFATVLSINKDKTCNVMIVGGETPYTNLVNKTGETLETGDNVLIEALKGNIGNGYIKLKLGISDVSGAPDSVAWAKIYDTPTTLNGYGIQDAKIENGTITLGTNSITPLSVESVPVKSVNNKIGNVMLTFSDVNALPNRAATATTLGGVKVGSGLTIDDSGTLSVNESADSIDWSTIKNIPTTLNGYGITDGATISQVNVLNTKVNTNENNIASVASAVDTLQNNVSTAQNEIKSLQDTYVPKTTTINNKALYGNITLDSNDVGALPNRAATSTTLGGIKVGAGLIIDANGVLNATGGGVADAVDWAKVQNKPTTIEGYGITDAVTSVNYKSGIVNLTASDVGALAITGGTLTGNLQIGSTSLRTNGYVIGTWLQGTASNHLNYTATKFAVQDASGWIYHRTASEVRTDIGAGNTNLYKIDNVSIPTTAWVNNTNSQALAQEKVDFPFMATISITNPAITENDIARVVLNYVDQISGNFAPVCYTIANGVIIEAADKPSETITLSYILIERIL